MKLTKKQRKAAQQVRRDIEIMHRCLDKIFVPRHQLSSKRRARGRLISMKRELNHVLQEV